MEHICEMRIGAFIGILCVVFVNGYRGLRISPSPLFFLTECSTKDSSSGRLKLNSPIVIAWSNSGHNHFIPLVPVKGKPLPKLPQSLFPKVWGPVDDTTLLPQ